MFELRQYQKEALDALNQYLADESGNPLVVLPTASGKSIIMAKFVQQVLDQSAGKRILILTHVKELIEQNYRELLNVWDWAPSGIYSAGLRRPRGKGTGEAPIKICPNCNSIIYAAYRTCPDCGYVFPVKPAHFQKASNLAILSDDREEDLPGGWIRVRDIFYSRYQKADKPPTLCVAYLCAGGKQYYRWIPVEGNDFAKLVARRWFVEHGIPYDRIPKTVNEALKICREFKVPQAITVQPDGQYFKIVKYNFESDEAEIIS